MNILEILGDKNRLRIVMILIDREMCMSHIYLGLDLKQANTSKHIKVLKEANIIDCRISKQNRYFSLSKDFIDNAQEIINYLRKCRLEESYLDDEAKLIAVASCSCINQCECLI
ncbi:MAG: ArsR/SmtB family transcription factor [Bacilli bacterium]